METSTTVRRGRPRSFDRKLALESAMRLFWANGYDGTSINQLVDALGIAPPSIYAAFGSKEDLFREAVHLYLDTEIEPAWALLDEIADVRVAVKAMFDSRLGTITATETTRGCLIMLGANHLGCADESVGRFLREQRARFQERLVKRLEQGIRNGDISPDSNAEALADCILAFSAGMAIKSADGASRSELSAANELFCQQIF